VFHTEHGVQIIVVLDDHARTELGGRDRHRLRSLLIRLQFEAGGRRASHTSSAATKAKLLFYTQLRRKRNLSKAELIVKTRVTRACESELVNWQTRLEWLQDRRRVSAN
jgi:hypothetical protein